MSEMVQNLKECRVSLLLSRIILIELYCGNTQNVISIWKKTKSKKGQVWTREVGQ